MSSVNSSSENDRSDYSMAVKEAVDILQHGGHFDIAATGEQYDEVGPDSDYGMTREIMGPDYGDNLSALRVDFDQWMHNHATLDEEGPGSSDEEYSSETEDYPQDINSAWAMARNDWGVNSSNAVTQLNSDGDLNHDDDDAPISIGSSDPESCYSDEYDEDEDDGMMEENDYYSDEAAGMHEMGAMESSAINLAPFASVPDQYQQLDHGRSMSDSTTGSTTAAVAPLSEAQLPSDTMQFSSNSVSAIDQDAVANAMLFLTKNVCSPISQPIDSVKGLTLPILPTSCATESLSEMHDAINCSIDRSLALVEEIESICDRESSIVEKSDQQSVKLDTENDATSLTEETLDIVKRTRAESLVEKNKLNAQIFKLNTELFQLETEKSELAARVSELETESDEQTQTIDELREQLSNKGATDEAIITELKDRIKNVAAKVSSLQNELDSTNASFADTRQAFSIVSNERTALTEKCNTLEGEITSLSSNLENERQAHKSTQEELRLARDGNTSELRRLELEDLNTQLKRQCSGLKKQLSASHEKERLLLNSNRALEARLRDVLHMAEQPVTPEDILADHRRVWDAQLIDSRASAKEAQDKLLACEATLQAERLANTQLQERLREMAALQSSLDQSAKKRKLEAEDSENRWSVDSNRIGIDAIRSIVTPTRPGTTEAKRQLLEDSHSRFRQAVVDAGEYARDRRRRNAPHLELLPHTPRSSTTANFPNSPQQQTYMDKPVTPRINIRTNQAERQQSPHQKQYDIASLISPFQKSAR